MARPRVARIFICRFCAMRDLKRAWGSSGQKVVRIDYLLKGIVHFLGPRYFPESGESAGPIWPGDRADGL